MRTRAWCAAGVLLAACGRRQPPAAAAAPEPVRREAEAQAPPAEAPRDARQDAVREKLYRDAVVAKALARALRTRLSEQRTALAAPLAVAEGREREVLLLAQDLAARDVYSGAALLSIDTALERAETLFADGRHVAARDDFAKAASDIGPLLKRLDLAVPTVRARLDLRDAATEVAGTRAWFEQKKLPPPANLARADEALAEGRRLVDAGDFAGARACGAEARGICQAATREAETRAVSVEEARAQRGAAEVALGAWEKHAEGAGGDTDVSRAARAKLAEGDRLLAENDAEGATIAYQEAAFGFETAIEAGETEQKARVKGIREKDSPPPPPPGIKGDSRVVAAVGRALDWLAHQQDDAGKWDCGVAGAGDPEDVLATALALLCFLDAGFVDRGEGPAAYYAPNVSEALGFLVSGQGAEGHYCERDSQLLAHAVATLAMCEAYRQTKDPALGASAGNAVRIIERAGQVRGWLFPDGTEFRGSAWCARALVSARDAGIDVNLGPLQHVLGRLEKRTWFDGTAETAATISIRILGGQEPLKTPAIREGLRTIAAALPTTAGVQYWYQGAVATRLASQSYFGRWRASVSPLCLKTQVASGPDAGSWSPEDGEPRCQATALMTLTLIECAK